jgi:hypothetical protein
MQEKLSDEMKAFILKIIIPALVAVSIKIAIQCSKQKVSIAQVVGSFVTGIGSAYLFADYVMGAFAHQWQPLIIAVIAISGEKIGYYVMYKINIDGLMEIIIKNHKK